MTSTTSGSWHALQVDAQGEESLIRAAAIGDRRAFDELVRRHLRPLLSYTTRLVSDPSSAEDIAQETFIAAWRNLPDYEQRSSFRTWLFTIASRKAIDLRRRRAAIPTEDDKLDGPDRRNSDPYDQYVGQTLFDALKLELERLSYHARACWWLREVEGFSHEEIASALSITRGSVRGHLQRARAHLAQQLAPWNPDSHDRSNTRQTDTQQTETQQSGARPEFRKGDL